MGNESKYYDELRNRYVSLFGDEPSSAGNLAKMEKSLHVLFPDAFKEIAKFYRGGIIGGVSHHSTGLSGPFNNIPEETLRIRKATKLPTRFVVLAEPPASLIVLDTDNGSVIWLDNIDIDKLNHIDSLHNPQIWNSYDDFFSFLLRQEEEERA
jgi:hypothetical protein